MTIYRSTESRFVVKLKRKNICASTTQYHTMQFHCNQHCMMSALLNNRSIPLVVGDLKQTDGHVNDMMSRMARELEALTGTEGLFVFPQHFKDEIFLSSKNSASLILCFARKLKNQTCRASRVSIALLSMDLVIRCSTERRKESRVEAPTGGTDCILSAVQGRLKGVWRSRS